MVVTPRPTSVPATGLCVMVTGLQLSLATVPVATSGTAAWQLPSAEALPPAGTEVIEGAVVSLTVKEVGRAPCREARSVAVTVIVVTPRPTSVPATGLCVMVTGLELSLATVPGATSGTDALQLPSAEALPPAGTEVIEGAVVSLTVKVVVLWL